LDTAEPQNLTINELFVAFGALLFQFNNQTGTDFCSKVRSNALLSIWMYSALGNSYLVQTFRPSVDYLRNMISMSLHLFNEMSSGILPGGGFAAYAVNYTQIDLPPKNRVNGSLARQVDYVAPEVWTIYAYLCVSGTFLILAYAAWFWSLQYRPDGPSPFLFIDILKLTWEEYGGTRQEDIATAFVNTDIQDTRKVIEQVASIRIHLKDASSDTSTNSAA
jgi:hypothetical protein